MALDRSRAMTNPDQPVPAAPVEPAPEKASVVRRKTQPLSLLGLVLTILLLTLCFLSLPRTTFSETDTDLPWNAVLNYAHTHHLQFGTDIVFTYGPLGFLVNRFFFLPAAGARILADLAFTCLSCGGIACLARKLRWPWAIPFLLVALYLFLNLEPRTDELMEIGLVCWGMLCLVQSGWRLAASVVGLALLLALGMLIKISFFFLALATCLCIAISLSQRKQFIAAVAVLFGPALVFLLGWLASGQAFVHLKPFLTNAFLLSTGYDQSMGLEGLPALRNRGILAVILIAATLLPRLWCSNDATGRKTFILHLPIVLWLGALSFAFWKYGFVREDVYHFGHLFLFASLLVFILEALASYPCLPLVLGRIFGLLACAAAVLTLHSFLFSSDLKKALKEPLPAVSSNVSLLLNFPGYKNEMAKTQETAIREIQLPTLSQRIGNATVDVFGSDQHVAIFNHLNFQPHPVFQNYVAYTQPLMRLNERSFLSSGAPEFVLFRLQTIDRKFPPLLDGLTFRTLLSSYDYVDLEKGWLLLKRRTNAPVALRQIAQGTVTLGEAISLAPLGSQPGWLEIALKPTLFGRVRQLLYKPPVIRLALWRGETRKNAAGFRASAPLLSAGFLVSPMLTTTESVREFYLGESLEHPKACSLEFADGTQGNWQTPIAYRLYALESLPPPR